MEVSSHPRPSGRIVAGGMLRAGTPVEDYVEQYGLWVKREDKACLPPGPQFSKTRGVYAHIAKRPEQLIGVLDTYHSQAGHAVARACQVLGKQCLNFYPEFKNEPGHRAPQDRAMALGATLYSLKAGRSAILFHQARKVVEQEGGYMMPNALKLEESVEETAKEVPSGFYPYDMVIIPASSGTIAAGVMRGFSTQAITYLIHLGYGRPEGAVRSYLESASGIYSADIQVINEGYAYKDKARPGETPPWPCNDYYDLKAFRWWLSNRHHYDGQRVLFWNIG